AYDCLRQLDDPAGDCDRLPKASLVAQLHGLSLQAIEFRLRAFLGSILDERTAARLDRDVIPYRTGKRRHEFATRRGMVMWVGFQRILVAHLFQGQVQGGCTSIVECPAVAPSLPGHRRRGRMVDTGPRGGRVITGFEYL